MKEAQLFTSIGDFIEVVYIPHTENNPIHGIYKEGRYFVRVETDKNVFKYIESTFYKIV